MSIKRYNVMSYSIDAEGFTGPFVKHEDHLSEVAKLQSQLTALTSQLESVVAENAVSNDRLQKLIQIINNADNSYCMCGDAMRNHAHGGCGYPTGMFDYCYSQWLESGKETPATDAFLAEVRASGVDVARNALIAFVEDEVGPNGNVPGLIRGAELCESIAAQLRQGGAV
ncbi:hypothetical protein [Lelliottia amnigena]